MDNADILMFRGVLKALKEIGAVGLAAADVAGHAELAGNRILTTAERGDLIEYLEQKRGWIYSYRNPVTKQVRYALTAAGTSALAGM